jgi:CheY-like chemotaxis protein
MASRRILVVDDEQEIVRVLRELLERQGYDVEIANDAAGALREVWDKP